MPATSSNAGKRALGVWRKRLHMARIDWLELVVALGYFRQLSGLELWLQGVPFCPAFIVALGLRTRPWAKARFRMVVA
jgi:hypothetical protein